MMIGARTAAWAKSGGGVSTARDYVQDGLIAMWDGIENAGWGVHDPNATVWKDLVWGLEQSLVNEVAFGDDHLAKTGTYGYTTGTYNSALADALNGTKCTIDVVYNVIREGSFGRYKIGDSKSKMIWSNDNIYMVVRFVNGTISKHVLNVGSTKGDNAGSCFSLVQDGGVFLGYNNGLLTRTNTGDYDYQGAIVSKGDVFTLLNNSENGVYNAKYSKTFCVRIYSRALTAEEIAHNYEIDKKRFGL